MDATQAGSVDLKVESSIATVTFFHPLSNSLPGRVLAQLAQTVSEAGARKDVHVIVLQSAGERAFCAGASFDELMAIEDEKTGLDFFMGFARVINACRNCGKIIVGRVQGKTVGGGVGLASAVDYCFATKYASVRLSELAVGIGPFVVGPAVERKVGLSAMSQMALDPKTWYDAEWARQKGLYAHVYDDVASMDAAIASFTEMLAGSNPEALADLKRIFWEDTENWDRLLEDRAAISGRLVLSDFSKQSIAAFKKK